MTYPTYKLKEIVQMAYDYIAEQLVPKIEKRIYGTDFVYCYSFKKWGAIIDFWLTYDSSGKIIKKSLIIKVYLIGRDLINNQKPITS